MLRAINGLTDREASLATRFFDNRLSHEWMGFTILRRVTIAFLIVHFSLAAVSGYRAIVQVYDVSLELASVLQPGSPVTARVATSGRTFVDARLELVQAAHSETLGKIRIQSNDEAFYDPRPKRAVLNTAIPSSVLSRFHRGRATIRAVAEGHSQFLRVPPPEVREATIVLGSHAGK